MNTDKFKQSAQKLNLNEKEKSDIDYALSVLEKVTKADMLFVGQVLSELNIKTLSEKMGDGYEMKNWSLEQCKRYIELNAENETKH
jgi:hypothetical protein